SWNARSQLSGITGSTSAAFQYDSFGRRTSKTVNSQSSQYLYDGPRVVQELSGGVPTANMLNGSDVDERHSCSCGGSNNTILSDALGSALALTDASGAVQTQYTYDAFGNTANSGSASSNSSQYTGRENDGTGLYYYRSRYYSPALQRFISQDPIGLAGGMNLYAYVGNSPVNLTDPFGTNPLAAAGAVCLEGAIVGAAMDGLINALTGRKVTLSGLARSAVMGCGMALVGLGLGRLFGPMIARMARAARARALAGRAQQVHEVLDPIAQEMRTTAAMATREGKTVVGGGAAKDLTKAQRAALGPGEVAAKLPGAHAEVTVMNHAAENGLTPTAIGVTRDICPVCAAAIESTGGMLTGPRTAIWPWP
ncbi:MAG TPA: RHS repeat-associated core domain-containing protein, partial [Pyrinomonadaceae bacterium]|nr:RHS repeat-associated core domain-containing protein [Pyrinomonadaceae bacterium]